MLMTFLDVLLRYDENREEKYKTIMEVASRSHRCTGRDMMQIANHCIRSCGENQLRSKYYRLLGFASKKYVLEACSKKHPDAVKIKFHAFKNGNFILKPPVIQEQDIRNSALRINIRL